MTELSKMDETLLDLAGLGMSAQEMSARTGLPAAKALLRVKEILRERDVYTEIEQRALLMKDLFDLKRKVKEQNDDVDWVTDKQAIALSKVIRDIDDLLEKQGKVNDELLAKVSMAQAAQMLRLLDAGMKRAKQILVAQHPELDMQEIQAAFQVGLQEAVDLVD